MENQKANQYAQELLLAVKKNEKTLALQELIENILPKEFSKEISNDNNKKAFWINIYNSYYQILRSVGVPKSGIYKSKKIYVAGISLSLDDIEHGILRKYKFKFSLGYLSNPFYRKVIKRLAVDEVDYRIHFALNCGAKSCPPIAFYKPQNINQLLDMATVSFLENETEVNHNKKTVEITALFKWFLGDFGGKRGIKKILKAKINLDTQGYKLLFKPYSWEDDLSNFSN